MQSQKKILISIVLRIYQLEILTPKTLTLDPECSLTVWVQVF